MKKILNTVSVLSIEKKGNSIALLIIVVFVMLAIARLYPFENTLAAILNGPTDDWNLYARYALDIKHNGILLHTVNSDYARPAGFLYNYFLALCFMIFGENTIPVFIIQKFLLGISIFLVFVTFRSYMKPKTGIIFLGTLFLFGLLDVSRYYTFHLLSENLAIFLIGGFFFCFVKGIEKDKLILRIFSVVVLGMIILTRPNIFPFGIAFILLNFLFFLKKGKAAPLNIILLIVFSGLTVSFLAIRNHFVSGNWTLLPTESIYLGEKFFHSPFGSSSHLFQNTLSCFGFLSFTQPEFHWRPHWTMMWIFYFAYLVLRIKKRMKFEFWEIVTHLFIFLYYLMIIVSVDPSSGSYGFRFYIPSLFIVLPFSCMLLDNWFHSLGVARR